MKHTRFLCLSSSKEGGLFFYGQTPKSGIPPNNAPKVVTRENYLHICDFYATLIGQSAIITLFGAILGGISLFGAYHFFIYYYYILQKSLLFPLKTVPDVLFACA